MVQSPTTAFPFDVVENWAQLPDGWDLKAITAGACDAQDRIYIFSRSAHPVTIFEPDGRFVGSWGDDLFVRPHGLVIGPDGCVYCTDEKDHTVRKCSPDGRVLMTLGSPGQPSDTGYDGKSRQSVQMPGRPFNGPTGVAFSPSGDIYVSDGSGNCRIHRFSPDGILLHSWGMPGSGPGEFRDIHGICTGPDGTVYVADRANNRVQIFGPDGEFITQWTGFHRPSALCLMPTGTLYVLESSIKSTDERPFVPPQLSAWTLDGKLLGRWGGDDPSARDSFFAPHALWANAAGDIYVGENSVSSQRGPIAAGAAILHKFVPLAAAV